VGLEGFVPCPVLYCGSLLVTAYRSRGIWRCGRCGERVSLVTHVKLVAPLPPPT